MNVRKSHPLGLLRSRVGALAGRALRRPWRGFWRGRLTLSGWLILAMAGLLLFASLVVWVSAQRNLDAAVYPARLNRMAADAQELAGMLDAALLQAQQDVVLLERAPATRRLVAQLADGVVDASVGPLRSGPSEDLAELFEALLAAKPDYRQVRLIEAAPAGWEILRVDRSGPGDAVRRVPWQELQMKGARDYVDAALRGDRGEVHLSPIGLNREHGAIELPRRPVVRAAVPVWTPGGRRYGVLAINLDVSRLFGQMRAAAAENETLAVIDRRGRLLLESDAAGEVAEPPHFGGGPRIQDRLRGLDLDALFAEPGRGFSARLADETGEAVGLAAAVVGGTAGGPVAVLLSAPRERLLAGASAVLRDTALSGLGALLVAGLLVVFAAWRALRPLGRIGRAIEAVDRGEPVSLPGAAGEIGLLARTFERHLERERLFSAAFAWANDAAMTLTPEGLITGWNRAAERLFGFTAEEAVGRPVALIVPPDRLAESAEIQRRFRAGERVIELETLRQDKSGRQIEVALTLSPVRAADGRIVGASELVRDIGARRAEEARFRLAVEASPAAMLMTDEQGVILLANGEAEAIFGYRADELVGQPVELLLPEHARRGHAELRHAFQAEPGKRMMGVGRDLYARRKDGSEVPVEVGLNPLRTAEGLIVLSTIVDTTERKRAELALRVAKQEAERASEMKTQFLANMSHELRTPLNAIIGYSDLMLSGVGGRIEPAKYADYLEDIKIGGTHLLALINDLLDLSRAESGVMTLDEAPVDLVAVAESAVKLMGADAQLRGLSLSLAVEVPSLRLIGDERMITQILLNLLSNALKFTPEGGSVTVTVNRSYDDEARLIVRDTGVGIPGSQIPRAFAAFVQVEDAYRREGNAGAGLGLALTKRFVELHRGRIALDSKENEGTTVTVTFPAGRCMPARLDSRARAPGAAGPRSNRA